MASGGSKKQVDSQQRTERSPSFKDLRIEEDDSSSKKKSSKCSEILKSELIQKNSENVGVGCCFHNQEMLDSMCFECMKLLCNECAQLHSNHQIMPLSESNEICQKQIDSQLIDVNKLIEAYMSQEEELTGLKNEVIFIYKQQQHEIQRCRQHVIDVIEQRSKELLAQCQSKNQKQLQSVNQEQLALRKNLKQLIEQHLEIQNTIISNNKDHLKTCQYYISLLGQNNNINNVINRGQKAQFQSLQLQQQQQLAYNKQRLVLEEQASLHLLELQFDKQLHNIIIKDENENKFMNSIRSEYTEHTQSNNQNRLHSFEKQTLDHSIIQQQLQENLQQENQENVARAQQKQFRQDGEHPHQQESNNLYESSQVTTATTRVHIQTTSLNDMSSKKQQQYSNKKQLKQQQQNKQQQIKSNNQYFQDNRFTSNETKGILSSYTGVEVPIQDYKIDLTQISQQDAFLPFSADQRMNYLQQQNQVSGNKQPNNQKYFSKQQEYESKRQFFSAQNSPKELNNRVNMQPPTVTNFNQEINSCSPLFQKIYIDDNFFQSTSPNKSLNVSSIFFNPISAKIKSSPNQLQGFLNKIRNAPMISPLTLTPFPRHSLSPHEISTASRNKKVSQQQFKLKKGDLLKRNIMKEAADKKIFAEVKNDDKYLYPQEQKSINPIFKEAFCFSPKHQDDSQGESK